jgi:hypothetical protein
MVKHSVDPLIPRFLDPDSIGSPQYIAALLLFIYLLQCMWLIHVEVANGSLPDSNHELCIYHGLEQWRRGDIAGTPETLRSEAITGLVPLGQAGHLRVNGGYDRDRSPLYYLTCAAPLLVKPSAISTQSTLGQWWTTTPYLFFGVMLGGSLWYVARRLYGNAGGYIALTLYCFSPAMIMSAAGSPDLGEIGGTWGAFGMLFTAIAVAHTLYAPREVVLWNTRRILLLGLSLFLAVANQFSLAPLALVGLLLMVWVAPVRPRAVIVIWTTAIAVGAVLLLLAYFARPVLLWHSLRHACWIDLEPAAFGSPVSYSQMLRWLFAGSPALILALPAALIAYIAWKRTRYFGNTAPLTIAALLAALTIASPNLPGNGFRLAFLVFFFVFVAGVFADLFETQHGALLEGCVFGLFTAAAFRNLIMLAFLR